MQQRVFAEGRVFQTGRHGLAQAGVNRQHRLHTQAARVLSGCSAATPPRPLTRPLALSGAWLRDILRSALSSSCQAQMLMAPTLWFSADLGANSGSVRSTNGPP